VVFVRTIGHLKVPLLYYKIAVFIGATLCGIIHLHDYAVRLFSGFVVEILLLDNSKHGIIWNILITRTKLTF